MSVATVVTTVISVASLAIVIYREFVQGPRLTSAVDQIVTLHLGEPDKKELLVDMLADDLLSGEMSPTGQQLAKSSTALRAAVGSKDRSAVRQEVVNLASRTRVNYDPTDDQIRQYLTNPRFALPLYLPIIIANSGKRVGHLSSLLLVLESKVNRSRRFVFSALAQIDPDKFLKRHEAKVDADRIAGMFPGVSIAPGSSVTVHALMAPMLHAHGKRISDTNLQPGDYWVSVFGYGHGEKLLLRSNRIGGLWPEKYFIDAFKGGESANYLTTEGYIEKALKLLDD